MSEAGRKDFTTQAKEKATPDSQKSVLDQTAETATGAYDRAAGALQPESEKSTSQKLGDSVRGGSDDAESQSKGVLQSAQETISSTAQSVTDTLSGKK
ncbi:hypothetical protein EJ06DRAFT_470162 [Trichodelitschia bisporula]|uniref:Chaperone/heat shock protein Hsp12 n=1 Tax=Trichodelitschia bisporula TaxID=703511 RepID=A0A6G1I8Z3_9PEZI|nr:hypothetical protein EJ06DRAFT_470162 [Trichodelitschia bisporula]